MASLYAKPFEKDATQDKKWVIIQEQLAIYEQTFHFLSDCDQVFLANQQLNFNYDSVSSLLSMIHASAKKLSFHSVGFLHELFKFDPCLGKKTFADVGYCCGVAPRDL